MSDNPLMDLNQWQKGQITKAVRRGIILCEPGEKIVARMAEKFGIPPDAVWNVYNEECTLTPEALAERSKLLSKERHTQRGLMVARLELTYAQASEEGDVKTAMQCLRMLMDLFDLKLKPSQKRDKPIKAKATEVKPTALSDEELQEMAKKGIPK